MLSPEQGQALVRLARSTIEAKLGLDRLSAEEPLMIDGRHGGAFVTLRSLGRLRGCIGQISETTDIVACVRRVAAASLHDDRFVASPVTVMEADRLRIEVSVLSSPFPMRSIAEVLTGVHGVLVRQNGRAGCFLPKVAPMQHWDAEEFLAQCCVQKAGLPPTAWRDAGAQVQLFTVEEFNEDGVTGERR